MARFEKGMSVNRREFLRLSLLSGIALGAKLLAGGEVAFAEEEGRDLLTPTWVYADTRNENGQRVRTVGELDPLSYGMNMKVTYYETRRGWVRIAQGWIPESATIAVAGSANMVEVMVPTYIYDSPVAEQYALGSLFPRAKGINHVGIWNGEQRNGFIQIAQDQWIPWSAASGRMQVAYLENEH